MFIFLVIEKKKILAIYYANPGGYLVLSLNPRGSSWPQLKYATLLSYKCSRSEIIKRHNFI